MEKNHDIVLFDGVCNLCNSAILFIIKRDKKDRFRFTSLDSYIGKVLLSRHNIDPSKIDSIVLISGDSAFAKADAALNIAKHLNHLWPLLYAFKIIPSFISNKIYDFIARNRYKWFGKKESCMIPTPNLTSKFL
ncbi:thiol-disulfide oxidoreductase DCC family protein [uncultured Nonlabens sp.]|uniref:thiol-disulfide oxidoreductase DCC family protein n=1 Tax=uncultured Nonlabens sp. TaxID=859306 RepID=UPI00262E6ADD|nr:thiol-disulfide oxidoreductase DCC family protein [uncultured Nonlabens sp.]